MTKERAITGCVQTLAVPRQAVRRRLAACGLAVLTWMTAAYADETDWLYFPMYSRDTAHAVNLQALSWRPDGLLASGTRYPHYSGEPWTEEESNRGWYNYEKRLIDCSLGFYVSTDIQLLAADGKVIASHAYTPQDWVESLGQQLSQSQTKPWPQRDEILLACAAASAPKLKKQRAQMARSASPRISFAPITADLANESDALMRLERPRYVLNVPNQRPPATAEALFDRLRQQYLDWRKSVVGPAAVQTPAAAASRAGVERTLGEYLQPKGSGAIDAVRVLPGDVLEYPRQIRAFELPDLSPSDEQRVAQARSAFKTERLDCMSGLALPMSVSWRDDEGKVLLTKRVPVKEAAKAVRWADDGGNDGAGWDLRWGPIGDTTLAGALCRVLIRVKTNTPPSDTHDDPQATLLSALTPQRLAQESTPEAMLLAIRAAWRDIRP